MQADGLAGRVTQVLIPIWHAGPETRHRQQPAVLRRLTLPTYDGRPLRQDHPGRDSLFRSRFEEELGWLDLFDEDMPCGLTAYHVILVNASTGVDLSAEDERAVEAGRSTLIRVVVACGGG